MEKIFHAPVWNRILAFESVVSFLLLIPIGGLSSQDKENGTLRLNIDTDLELTEVLMHVSYLVEQSKNPVLSQGKRQVHTYAK